MATPPTFTSGSILTAAQMNSVGLWLVKTQTIGTAVSSVTLTNTFSSDFDNYRVLVNVNDASVTGSTLNMTLTGISGSVYYDIGWQLGWASSITAQTPAAATYWKIGYEFNTFVTTNVMDIFNPYLSTARTSATSTQAGPGFGSLYLHQVTTTTSATGFTITPSSGTITGGTIRVYGYRN